MLERKLTAVEREAMRLRYRELRKEGRGLSEIFRQLRRERLFEQHRKEGKWISISEATRLASEKLQAKGLPEIKFGTLWQQLVKDGRYPDFEVRPGTDFEEAARTMTIWERTSTRAKVEHHGNASFVHESAVDAIVAREAEQARTRALIAKHYFFAGEAAREVGLGSKQAFLLHARNGFPYVTAKIGGFKTVLVPKNFISKDEKGNEKSIGLKPAFEEWRQLRKRAPASKPPGARTRAPKLEKNSVLAGLNLLKPKIRIKQKPPVQKPAAPKPKGGAKLSALDRALLKIEQEERKQQAEKDARELAELRQKAEEAKRQQQAGELEGSKAPQAQLKGLNLREWVPFVAVEPLTDKKPAELKTELELERLEQVSLDSARYKTLLKMHENVLGTDEVNRLSASVDRRVVEKPDAVFLAFARKHVDDVLRKRKG